MKTSKSIFNRKAFAFLGAAAFMFAAVFIAGCKTEVSSSDPVPETFALTFKPGEHGSVDAKVGGKAIATGAKLEKGTTVEFTAKPDEHYEVDKWTVTGGELVEGTGAEGSTTAKVKITANTNVSVNFKAEVLYTVVLDSFDPAKKLPVIKAIRTITGLGLGEAKALVENAPQVIKDGLTEAEADEIITAITEAGGTASKSDKKTYTVKATAGEHGTIEASPKVFSKVLENTEITFTAKPESGYEVDKWSVTGGELVEGTGAEGSTTAKVKITANTKVSVNFIKKSYTVSFDAKGGSPVPETQKVPYGEKVNAPAAPTKDGYDFEGWYNKDGGAKWEFAVNTVSSDVDLYAKWNLKKYAVTFSVNGGNGSLSAKLDGNNFTTGGQVEHGKMLEFTATPNSEYEVDKWTVTGGELIEGTGAGGCTSAKVKVTGDVTVSVTFTHVYEPVSFSDLSNYLQNTASSTDINYIEVRGLTAADLKGWAWGNSSPLGEILRANSDKNVALKFGGNIEGLTDMSWCFYYCISLTQVPVIPSGVTNMAGCFYDCVSLTQAPEIPSGVTDMSWCFYGCGSLTQVPEIPTGVTDMSCCFYGCGSLTQAPEIPAGVTDMSCCFRDCVSLTQAPAIPTGVTNMGGCFEGCTSLTQAPAIPSSVTRISGCFGGCTNLTQAPEIPAGVTNMGGCFSGCTSLTQAPAIPTGVTDMSYCFYGCTSLTQAPAIPTGVTNMEYCFYGCTKLESAVLKCEYRAGNFGSAFRDCTSLPVGGIKVPAVQLGTYRTNASVMGVPADDRFAAE